MTKYGTGGISQTGLHLWIRRMVSRRPWADLYWFKVLQTRSFGRPHLKKLKQRHCRGCTRRIRYRLRPSPQKGEKSRARSGKKAKSPAPRVRLEPSSPHDRDDGNAIISGRLSGAPPRLPSAWPDNFPAAKKTVGHRRPPFGLGWQWIWQQWPGPNPATLGFGKFASNLAVG